MEMQKTPKFLTDFSTIRPSFDQKPEETALFAELRSTVEAEIARLPKLEWQLYFKAILFPLVYFGIYLFALSTGFFWQFVASYALLGWMVVLIFLNLLHETAHDNVFPSKRMNGFYLYFFDLIGANSHLWKLRHVVFHHNFPNVMGWDRGMKPNVQ